MPRFSAKDLLRAGWFWAIFLSLAFGSVAGWFSAQSYLTGELARLEDVANPRTVTPTSTQPIVQVVRVDGPTVVPRNPPALVTRRSSPVLAMVKRATVKAGEDGIVATDREIGSAVAATSDGWLVSTASALAGLKVSDLSVLWDGRTFPVVKGVRDAATDVVFLKIDARDLPVTAFVSAEDIVLGQSAWVEPRAKHFYAESLVDVRLQALSDPQTSEHAVRRFLVSFPLDGKWAGSAMWDERGQLIGLLDAKRSDGWSAIPAGNIPAALNTLLATNEIRHATLGVRSIDLASVSLDANRDTVGDSGAWLRPDKRTMSVAVSPLGPSAKLLLDGDVIERVERDILDGTADLGEHLLAYRPGTSVTVYGRRQGTLFNVTIKLGNAVTSEALK